MEGNTPSEEPAEAHDEPDVFDLFDDDGTQADSPFIQLVSNTSLRLKAAGHVLRTGKIPAAFAGTASKPPARTHKAASFVLPARLQEKFRVVTELPHQDRNILHIAVPAALYVQSKAGQTTNIDALIAREKDIEALLLYLKERYRSDVVYAEGVTSELLGMCEQTRVGIEERRREPHMTPLDVTNHIEHIARTAEREAFADKTTRAAVLYILHLELRTELDLLLLAKTKVERGEDIPRRYSEYFAEIDKKHIDFNSVVETIRDVETSVAHSPLLRDELVYLGGGALKLFLEKYITLYPAEIVGVKKADTRKEKSETAAQLERRENTALSLVRNDLTLLKTEFIPLIYGQTHNFSNNIETINQVLSEPFGLLRLEYREQ